MATETETAGQRRARMRREDMAAARAQVVEYRGRWWWAWQLDDGRWAAPVDDRGGLCVGPLDYVCGGDAVSRVRRRDLVRLLVDQYRVCAPPECAQAYEAVAAEAALATEYPGSTPVAPDHAQWGGLEPPIAAVRTASGGYAYRWADGTTRRPID